MGLIEIEKKPIARVELGWKFVLDCCSTLSIIRKVVIIEKVGMTFPQPIFRLNEPKFRRSRRNLQAATVIGFE